MGVSVFIDPVEEDRAAQQEAEQDAREAEYQWMVEAAQTIEDPEEFRSCSTASRVTCAPSGDGREK
jgi:transcription elongation GreA/GreB family factor